MRYRPHSLMLMLLLASVLGGAGCRTLQLGSRAGPVPAAEGTPRELCKAILPPYTIEPPDILLIDAIHVQPKHPYRLRTGDVVALHVPGALSEAPIDGMYPIEPGGTINLGYSYEPVQVAGMDIEQAQTTVNDYLEQSLTDPQTSLSLAEFRGQQQIAGEHLVGPDGTVTLGSYGSVRVVNMTLAEAKRAVEEHLSEFIEDPEVSVDVFAYNSKVYYIITQGAGLGDGVYRFPVTGNETVLDAISQINGLEQVSSKKIWIARAGRDNRGCHQILPIDWNTITQCGAAETNYQLFPGDRVYIAEDKLIALDTALAKLIAPIERIMGFSILGASTVTRFSGSVLRGGGNPSGRR